MTAASPPNQDATQARVTPTRIALTISLVVAVIATMFAMTTIAQSTQSTPSGAQGTAQGTASPGAQDLAALRQTAIDDGVDQLELEFVEYNDSGIEGTATLYAIGDATLIAIAIEDGGEAHPAHIHVGTCDDLTPEPFAALGIVENEVDRLVLIATPFQDLLDRDYSIDLHLAPTELGTLIACADIAGTPTPATPVASPAGTPTGTGTPVGTPDGVGGDDRTPTPTPQAVTATIASTETPTAIATGTPTPSATVTPTATVEPTATTTATEAVPAVVDPTETATIPVIVDSTSTPPSIEATATPPDDGTGGIGVIPDGKGETVVQDGTGGSGVPPDGKGDAIAQDGTGGIGDSTEPEQTTTLPRRAGVGSSIVQESATATILALGTFSLVLAGAAVAVRRAEHGGDGPRWGRLGL